ncbi:MAG: GAF domain-containing protein [Deltaproteobacteria bacterium]|nr:GAF domain-containing protein [Deltaproteobacteria bacterium]
MSIGNGGPETSADAATDELGGRLDALRAEARLAGKRITKPHPLVLSLRSDEDEVLLIPGSSWAAARDALTPYEVVLRGGSSVLVLLGAPSRRALDEALELGLAAVVRAQPTADELFVAIHTAFELLSARGRAARRGEWVTRYRSEIGELVEIAQALTTERRLDRLLELILEKGRYITRSDAGSIYVVEGDAPNISERMLRFTHTQNDSITFDAREFRVPVSERSMSGYVALHRTLLNIADVYELPEGAPYGFDATFDQTIGYRTRSMLCAPLLARSGEVLGVLQLINRKARAGDMLSEFTAAPDEVIPFDSRSESLLTTLASLAGVSLENAILAAENERMLEGFVRASVEAIEQRDPTTSGHSIRVARMSVGLARALQQGASPQYREVRWSGDDLRELEYASLLHDFGKIGVREQVLVKAKKLYPHELEAVRTRFELAERALDVERLERLVKLVRDGAPAAELVALDDEFSERRRDLAGALDVVCQCNEPTVLRGGDFATLEELGKRTFRDHEGRERPLLTPSEVTSLSVSRGSLTAEEFMEIRSHVVHTFQFLSTIPWGTKLRRVPAIAVGHHERLDGTGYPRGLRDAEIPLQSKIMAVSDIFDALTAADRPYKRSVPLERALDILGMEVRDGHIDGELVRVFREARVWDGLDEPLGSS